MPSDFRIEGAEQLDQLARRLKVAGDRELRKELLAEIRKSAKPTIPEIRDSALDTLPKAGGLAEKIAKSKIGVRTRLSGDVGVQIKGTGVHNIGRLNKGLLRKPLFGNRSYWFNQAVRPNWFTAPIKRDEPRIHNGIRRAMDNVGRKITRG